MSRIRIFGLVCAGVVLVAGCGEDLEALGQDQQAAQTPPGGGGTTPPFDPCAGYGSNAFVPDATLTMGASVTEKKQQLAAPLPPPFPWLQPSCPARVVDVVIPSTSSPKASDCTPNGCYPVVEITAGAASFPGSTQDNDSDYLYLPSNATSCNGYHHFVRLYKKLSGQSSFSYVREFQYNGHWTNGFCSIEDSSPPSGQAPYFPNDLTAPLPPPSGTDVYRVVASITVGLGNYIPLRFLSEYEPM